MNSATQLNMNYKATSFFKNGKAQSNKRLLGFTAFVVLVNILIHFELWHHQIWTPFALFSLLLFVFIWPLCQKEQRLIVSKKTKKIQHRLKENFPEANYYTNISIEQKDFIKSRLYDNMTFNYEGNSLVVSGKWEISNVSVSQYLKESQETISVFDGIFAKTKFQSSVKGSLIIKPIAIPDKAGIPKVLQQLIHRYFSPKILCSTTGNIQFDNKFEVFSNPPKLQSQILNLKMTNRILEIEEKLTQNFEIISNCSSNNMTKPALEISFTGSHIYMGIRGLKLFSNAKNTNYENNTTQKCIEIIEIISQINLNHNNL